MTMARIIEPTPEQETEWKAWVASLPDCVRIIAERFDPWSLYQMKSTGHRCTLLSISENYTVTVAITGDFNAIMFDRQVFGISPDDLAPCDLPGENEAVGTLVSSEQVGENIDALRVMIRPDLFSMDENGKAVRNH
jgi:hypothetical protein